MNRLLRMSKNRRIFVYLAVIGVLLFLVLVAAGCGGKTAGTAPPKEVKPLDKEMEPYYVDVAWLKENLSKVVVLDARSEKEYNEGHIPGAINVTWQSLSNMTPKQGEAGWGVVLPQEELAKKIGSFGIDGKKPVIVYNDPKGLGEEGRVLWMLRIAGLKDSRMLNGGFPAWKAGGGEISKEVPAVKPVDFKITSPDNSLLATTDYIRNNMSKIKLVDARSTEEYTGKTNHGEKALGHIPGAISIPYNNAYNSDGTIKSIPELKEMFTKAGLNPGDDIVVYCTVGIRSGFLTEILRMCGYEKAKNYNASFSEWAGLGLPVEK